MIRRMQVKTKLQIPANLRRLAKGYADYSFRQEMLEFPIRSISVAIPYPIGRQAHSLVVLGSGGISEHTDTLPDYLLTSYCIPFHIPKGARLWQGDQRVMLESGRCYYFNQSDYHQVDVPDGSRTYSAFIIVDILKMPVIRQLS